MSLTHTLTAGVLPLLVLSLMSCKGDPATDTGGGSGSGGDDGGEDSGDPTVEHERITILHTNDWQSHMLGWGPNAEYSPGSVDDDDTVGGLARAATLVDEIRGATTHPVLLLDGGDWMGGALFQELRDSHAAELQVLQAMGYDAVVVGNHELDWGHQGFASLVATADTLGVDVPLLLANLEADPADPDQEAFAALRSSGRVQDSLVLDLDNGLSVGLLGLMGDDAYTVVAPSGRGMVHTLPEEVAPGIVDELRGQGVDLVVAVTHNGVRDDVATSPDHILAASAQIDVIVGGHSHTPLPEPLVADSGTVIVQAGAYTRYVGELVLARAPGEAWEVESYTLHELDDSILGDPDITAMVDEFIVELDNGPLAALGTSFSAPVAKIPGDVSRESCAESGLGNLVTDAYRWSLGELDPEHPIDVAFESQGVIRDSMTAGRTGVQGFSDVFRVLPLGEGADGRPGYGLVEFYVTAEELKGVCEVTATISPLYGCSYFIEQSGMRCTWDDDATNFFKMQTVELWDEDAGEYVVLDTEDTETLYHVAVDTYVAGLMYVLEDLTLGLIAVSPKDAEGNLVDPLDRVAVQSDGITELKLWEALRDYSASFEDTDEDGVPDVPERYLEAEGRLVAE